MAMQSAPSIWIVLVLAICGTWAYQPEPHSRQQSYGSYDGQGAGLSTSHQHHSTYDEHHRNNKNNYNDRIQEQPIYERQEPQTTEYFTGCPAEFTGLLPYAYDCHRFVNCFKGQPNIQSCGPGTAFNPTSLVCDHADKVSCGANALLGSQSQRTAKLLNAEPNCAPGLTGLQPHPTDCSKFLNCANGQTFVQDCGPGTAFSIAMLTCDHVEKVDCGARTYGLTGSLSCPPGARGLRPYPSDPHKYLKCGIGVEAQLQQCQSGAVFDKNSLSCAKSASGRDYESHTDVSPSAHISDLLCPANVAGLFAHPFDHTKFLNCKAGKVSVQSCPPNHAFSISKSHCSPKINLAHTDYVAYVVSEVSYEYSLMLTGCPPGTDGLNFYPYDAAKYLRCATGGKMTVLSCESDMAYSIVNRACRASRYVTSSDRVKFLYELQSETGYSYGDTQAFQSSLSSCPPSLSGSYPYAFHGGKYVLCQLGLLHVESCATGSVFSLSKRKCAPKWQLTSHDYLDYTYITEQLELNWSTDLMLDLTTVTCPPKAQGYYLHPFDCTKFLICRDQQTLIESCQSGSVFSISKRRCVSRDQVEAYDRVEYLTETQNEFYEENGVSVGQSDRSKYGKDFSEEIKCSSEAGTLQPHPTDCSKFLNCANGQTFIQDCGPGTAFSATLMTCDHKDKVECGVRSYGSSASLSCPSNVRGLIPHPHDPYKYLRCDVGVQAQVEQCQLGAVFDKNSLSCAKSAGGRDYESHTDVSSSAHISDLLCPANVAGIFAHPFDHTKFLNCKAGKVSVQSCPPNHAFSISKSHCSPKINLAHTDYVAYVVSEVSFEYSLMLTGCPPGTEGLHFYPYDAAKYLRCATGGQMTILNCEPDMAYSIGNHACRASRYVTSSDRVKFLYELQSETGYSYGDTQAFQSSLSSCPPSLSGSYPYAFHGGKYVMCQRGLLHVESCATGSVFSFSKRKCAPKWQLTSHDYLDYTYITEQLELTWSTDLMLDLTTVTCPPKAQGCYLHPFDCTKFLICRDHQTLIESCQSGSVFSISKRRCVSRDQVEAYDRVEYLTETQNEFYEENGVSVGQSDRSKYGKDFSEEIKCSSEAGTLQPHPTDCSKFLNCANGQTFIQDCGPGTAFSATLMTCDHKDKVECGVRSYGSSASLSCPSNVRGLLPHPHDPYKYLRCDVGVQAQVEQCQLGAVFDKKSLSCAKSAGGRDYESHTDVSSSAHISDLLCPANVAGIFAHPFDHTKFLNCKAGKVSVQSCPPNHAFSISKSHCSPKINLAHTDYVAYVVSEVSYEYSLMLTGCPPGTEGLHFYPYDAAKYLRCATGGKMTVLSCEPDMAYSIGNRACRASRYVTSSDRVKFLYELQSETGYSYGDTQAFQSSLSSCPPSLSGSYPYAFHGGKYVMCQRGLLHVESCATGSVFSFSKRKCAPKWQLTSHDYLDYTYITEQLELTWSTDLMLDLTTVTCPPKAQGYYLHPFDCTKFLICRDQQTLIESCQSGSVFSISKRRCVSRDQVDTYDHVEYLSETQKEFYEENGASVGQSDHSKYGKDFTEEIKCSSEAGTLQPHPTDCSKFLNCANGQTFIQDCGPGTAFSATLMTCDHKDKVECGVRSYGSTNSLSCPYGVRGLQPHPHDPHKYLRCGIGVQAQVEQCQPETVFDKSTLSCIRTAVGVHYDETDEVSSTAHENDILCPDTVVGIFAHPFDYTKFLSCKAGKIRVDSCILNHAFSLSKGYCVPKENLAKSDYVVYVVSEVSNEYILKLTSCPPGTEGLHVYPYDAEKYVQCDNSGKMSILRCEENMAYSIGQHACRARSYVTSLYRVKFLSELQPGTGYSYSDTQALQSTISSCPSSLDGTYPYAFHGGKYVLCQHGLLHLKSCAAGSVYSFSQRKCAPKAQLSSHDYLDYTYITADLEQGWSTNEIDLTRITCPPQAQGNYLHPFDCTKFLNCRDHQTHIESCQSGSVFSISKRRCVLRDQVDAYDRVEYLSETQNEFFEEAGAPTEQPDRSQYGKGLSGDFKCSSAAGALQPHPTDCSKFLNCANGQAIVHDCAPGSAFSSSLRTCDHVEKVECGARIYGLTGSLSCPYGVRGLRPHPYDPHKYLRCGIGVKAQVDQCQPGAVFDKNSLSCVYSADGSEHTSHNEVPSAAHVSDILCPDIAVGPFAHPFDYTKFINCKTGKVSVQNCLPNHAFSLSQGYCLPKAKLEQTDYVAYMVSEVSHEYSLILTGCPPGTAGLHFYPYDAAKYVHCDTAGKMSILSCGPDMAYSIGQRACRANQYVSNRDRVKFLYELQSEISYNLGDTKSFQPALSACPLNLSGAYPYAFHGAKYLFCQHGLLELKSCTAGSVFSFSQRKCAPKAQLVSHDYLDYDYITEQLEQNWSTALTLDLTRITCPPQAQGYYLHPFDCTKFLVCRDQQTFVESCQTGSVFSISQRSCVGRDEVAAYDRVEFLTQTQNELYNENGFSVGGSSEKDIHTITTMTNSYQLECPRSVYGLYANPFDARSYLRCVDGRTLVQLCMTGEVYSLPRGHCLPLDQVPNSDRVSYMGYESKQVRTTLSCPYDFVGQYVYPFDCTKYLSCESGVTLLLSCPAGMHFSVARRICQSLELVQREDRVFTASELLAFFEWWKQWNSQHESNIVCPIGVVGPYQHPTVASKFLSCRAGQSVIHDCPSGKIFSMSRRLCVSQQEVPANDRCDYADNREPKFYAESGDNHLNQWVHGAIHGHRTTTTTTTSNGDRWSNMNMQRPSGVGYGQQETQTGYHETQQQPLAGWSGMGSSYDALAPTQSVLIVEGSLQPNRNYEQTAAHTIYQAPLAPMAPIRPSSPTTYYYAQPVDSSELESSSWQRQNHSRDINYGSHTSEWRPLPRQPVTLQQLRPNLELTPPLASEPGQQPLNLDNPYALTDQQPGETQQRPLELYGGFEPSIPFTKSQHPKSPYPTVPANHRPTYGAQPLSNESNLYGGLLPPPAAISPATHSATTPSRVLIPPSRPTPSSNVRTFPIYPPIANAPPSQKPNYPHYSPGYAGVAHSHNASWQKVPQTNPQQHQDPFDTQQVQKEDTQYEYEDIFDSEPQRSNRQPFSTTTAKRGLSPPPFNHQFYNPAKTPNPSMNTNSTSQLPISDALRMLLRPYFNHSGTAENELAQRAESSIMAVISKPPTTAATVTTPKPTTTTTARTPRRQRPDDDAELIVAGEQESLDDTDDDSVVAGAGEIARTEQTLQPTTYASNDDTNDFYLGGRGTRKVDTDRNNWQTHGHSRDFHLRHPNLPDPYDKPNHPYHGKHDHHHHHSHSPEYHRRHPELPNPFGAHSIETEETEILAHPNAEGVTPHTQVDDFDVNLRNSFDVTPASHCEFDCGGGKCIKQIEVCDGVNNCGNRQDERQCDHLGYALKITGGESPHMGRIEVKVNGKWGYVCDDKFGLHDADVVCREVGYKMGAAEVRGNSFYAPSEQNFNYAMDELECRGNETQLKDCDFKGWGVHNCGPDEVVGVVCKVPLLKCPNDFWLCATSKECIPPAFVCDNTEDCADKSDESDAVCNAPIKYRLEGGRSPAEGRLEVKYHGEWGSICDDDFSLKSAQVACNSLGYYGPAKIEKNIFGPGKGPIWLDQVSCYGNESAIDKCSHWSWGEHNCNHTEDVGLRCQAGPPPRSRIRLQAVNNNGEKKPQLSASSLSEIGIWERSSKSLNTPRRCGIFKEDLEDEYAHPEQRVVQGAVARRGRHPWQATIRTRGRGGISSHWCGAVLISKRHLLTAAHCLYGHPKGAYFVRVGDHYANIAESSEVDSFIENWYTHEKFRDQTHMNNDIALVVLKTPVKFSDYVQPICLPESGSQLKANRSCTISGWGSIKSGVSTPSQILRSASLPILPEATCKQPHVYGSSMTDGMFCAGHLDESVDACEGDSGGPLVCSDEDGETLYGIISWGQHCGYVNKPGVYVRVGHYIDWIFEKINLSLQRN